MKNCRMSITVAAKIPALYSGKVDKYDYLTGEEICSQKHRILKEGKLTYSKLGKVLKNK